MNYCTSYLRFAPQDHPADFLIALPTILSRVSRLFRRFCFCSLSAFGERKLFYRMPCPCRASLPS